MLELKFSRGVAEVDLLAGDPTRDFRHRDLVVGVLILSCSVGDITEPIHGESGLLKVLPGLSETEEGAGHIACQDAECDQLAECDLLVDHHVDTHPEDRDIVEAADECSDGRGARCGERVAKGGGDCVAVVAEPLPSAPGLDVLSLDRLNTREGLDKMGLCGGILLGTVLELSANDRGDTDG